MAFSNGLGWHFRVLDLMTAFSADNIAFWGLGYFFHELERAFLARSQTQQPAREFLLTLGSLQLSVRSTLNNMPISWDRLIWFSRLLARMVREGSFTETEFDAFVWDEGTGETVWIALRVLLDAPIRALELKCLSAKILMK
ncbi:MAG: hypothetical protein Q9191_007823, partial [Dirinaria sp. TL-2023a]